MIFKNYFAILILFLIIINPTINAKQEDVYVFIREFGSEGSDDGEFTNPSGITVDSQGYVYVADIGNKRIQKFDSNGEFITKWVNEIQLKQPIKLAVDQYDNIYVADYETNYIQKFNSNGQTLTRWQNFDFNINPFIDMYINFNNTIYVIYYPNIIVKYNLEGIQIQRIDLLYCAYYGEAIVVNSNGFIYLSYNPYGNVIYSGVTLHPKPIEGAIFKFDQAFNLISGWGNEGKKNGYFKGFAIDGKRVAIAKLGLDSQDNIYVLECGNNCIDKFDPNGNFITKFGKKGSGDGEFSAPTDITLDKEDNIYVLDTGNCRIQKFAPNPEYKQNK